MKIILLCTLIFYTQFAHASIKNHYYSFYIIKKVLSPINCALLTWYGIKWYKACKDIKKIDEHKKQLTPSNTSYFTIHYADLTAKHAISTVCAQSALGSIIGIVVATIGQLLVKKLTLFF